MQNQTAEYKFVRPSAISDYLKCPICLQVFKNAMRLYCGHTFCGVCLQDYRKQGTTCPECRTRIDAKNIGVDLLARQIINQFQVFCPAEDCPWKGMLQQLENHINKQCYFGTNIQKDKKIKKNQKIVWHQTLDQQVLDKINEHTAKGSLQARVLAKTDSLRDILPLKQQKPVSNTQSKIKKPAKKNQKKKSQPQVPQRKTSNFDFLSSLFE